jgi:putative chitinase
MKASELHSLPSHKDKRLEIHTRPDGSLLATLYQDSSSIAHAFYERAAKGQLRESMSWVSSRYMDDPALLMLLREAVQQLQEGMLADIVKAGIVGAGSAAAVYGAQQMDLGAASGNANTAAGSSTVDTSGTADPLASAAKAAAEPRADAMMLNPQNVSNTAAEAALRRLAMANGITGVELAAFLAQCAHESKNFTQTSEQGSPRYFQQYDPSANPRKAAILGNTQPGDGTRYKGRGYIHLTGRDNYARAGRDLRLPLARRPELVSRPDIATRTSVWYWLNMVRPKVSNFADLAQVTGAVNPGMMGMDERQRYLTAYLIPKR